MGQCMDISHVGLLRCAYTCYIYSQQRFTMFPSVCVMQELKVTAPHYITFNKGGHKWVGTSAFGCVLLAVKCIPGFKPQTNHGNAWNLFLCKGG